MVNKWSINSSVEQVRLMYEEILALIERYCNAKSDKVLDAIDQEMKALGDADGTAFGEAMLKAAQDTAARAEALALRQKMSEIIPAISLSYIAKTYFKKSRQWVYQRLNGIDVNGKPAKFSKDEIQILKYAMEDLSKKMGSVSISL